MNQASRGDRIHIGIYGRRNTGKSALINALTGQDSAIVSPTPGTTADPVSKPMELHPIGPVVFIDTAGFDDEGQLGELRTGRTKQTIGKTDVAVMVIDGSELAKNPKDDLALTKEWIEALRAERCPVIAVINKWDKIDDKDVDGARSTVLEAAKDLIGNNEEDTSPLITISAKTGEGIDVLREKIVKAASRLTDAKKDLTEQIAPRSTVLLVMPQDRQAPKGRLILPQVQTIRSLLDKDCIIVSTTPDSLTEAIDMMKKEPDWIITDSQCFSKVDEARPEGSKITSFSILMAQAKGDIRLLTEGAKAIDDLAKGNAKADGSDRHTPRILIAEACAHVPQNEDIGTVKIPRILKKILGENIEIVNVRGNDFPDEDGLKTFDLVIHCGACMFNRSHMISRISAAQKAGVPITNYGVFLAKVNGLTVSDL